MSASTSISGGGPAGGRGGRYRNPCLTMHQPWASLLVHGIKRIEGRSWPAPITGRLWIHAAGKVPEPETIKAMEDFYRQIYAVNGITDLKFPEYYPVSRLIGCVEVVGCLKCEELVCWEEVPESVRLEGLTDFCWLCERPQKLVVPFEMRGYQGVYNLENRIFDAAVRGLSAVEGPLPVKFPMPNPRDPYSLKPGALASSLSKTNETTEKQSSGLIAAIDGARAAATQFSKKNLSKDQDQNKAHSTDHINYKARVTRHSTRNQGIDASRNPTNLEKGDGTELKIVSGVAGRSVFVSSNASYTPSDQELLPPDMRKNNSNEAGSLHLMGTQHRATTKLFTAAMRDIRR